MMKRSKIKQTTKQLSPNQYEQIGRMMEDIVASSYASKKRFLTYSFLKGILYGLGIFIGGTIVVALLIWILTQFNSVPILSPFIEKILNIINTSGATKP